MDINEIWVFDVSKMNNRRFNAKRGVVRFRSALITLACSLSSSLLQFHFQAYLTRVSNLNKLLHKLKVVELAKLHNFFANIHNYIEIPDNVSKCHDFFLPLYYHLKIYFRKFIPFTPNSNWAIKAQYEKPRKSSSTLINSAKPTYHNAVPTIELKHNCA